MHAGIALNITSSFGILLFIAVTQCSMVKVIQKNKQNDIYIYIYIYICVCIKY